MKVTRRRTIAGIAAMPALAFAPTAAAARLAPFRALSARLTGFDLDSIHPDRARGIIAALLSGGDGPGLDRLLAGEDDEGDRALATRITEAWYLGTQPGANWPPSRLFHEALVWQALDFMRPPGVCGPVPGDWSRPPSSKVR